MDVVHNTQESNHGMTISFIINSLIHCDYSDCLVEKFQDENLCRISSNSTDEKNANSDRFTEIR